MRILRCAPAAVLALACAACGQPRSPLAGGAAPPVAAAPANAATATPTSARGPGAACELIDAARMSAFLGAPVTAKPISGAGDCAYESTTGALPNAQLKIEYGSGEVAMSAFGMLGRMEPGMANPYVGLGDQAVAIGPAVMIRRGEDLITITVMSGGDSAAIVRRIYDAIEPRV